MEEFKTRLYARMGDINTKQIGYLRLGHPLRLAYDCLLVALNGTKRDDFTQLGFVDAHLARLESAVGKAVLQAKRRAEKRS